MRWVILFSGVFVVIYRGAGAVDRYWAGVAFTKSWWPAMLAPIFLIAFLGLFVGCIWLVFSVGQRKTKPIWLLLLVFPALFVGIQSLSFPGFVDGMAHRLKRDFAQADFLGFAELARTKKLDWSAPSSEAANGMDDLKLSFPRIMGLSKIDPRVTLSDSHVDIFYGSSLVKHWGVRIMDRQDGVAPFSSEKDAYFLEALPGVFVYHLPY